MNEILVNDFRFRFIVVAVAARLFIYSRSNVMDIYAYLNSNVLKTLLAIIEGSIGIPFGCAIFSHFCVAVIWCSLVNFIELTLMNASLIIRTQYST